MNVDVSISRVSQSPCPDYPFKPVDSALCYFVGVDLVASNAEVAVRALVAEYRRFQQGTQSTADGAVRRALLLNADPAPFWEMVVGLREMAVYSCEVPFSCFPHEYGQTEAIVLACLSLLSLSTLWCAWKGCCSKNPYNGVVPEMLVGSARHLTGIKDLGSSKNLTSVAPIGPG
jgi:hypothetical protein